MSSNFMLKKDVVGLFARDDGPNACQMACGMQPYLFIGKPKVTPSVGQPVPTRAEYTEVTSRRCGDDKSELN